MTNQLANITRRMSTMYWDTCRRRYKLKLTFLQLFQGKTVWSYAMWSPIKHSKKVFEHLSINSHMLVFYTLPRRLVWQIKSPCFRNLHIVSHLEVEIPQSTFTSYFCIARNRHDFIESSNVQCYTYQKTFCTKVTDLISSVGCIPAFRSLKTLLHSIYTCSQPFCLIRH